LTNNSLNHLQSHLPIIRRNHMPCFHDIVKFQIPVSLIKCSLMSEILAGSTFSSFISRLYFFLPIQRAQIILSGVELQNLPWNAIYVKAEKSLSDDNLPSLSWTATLPFGWAAVEGSLDFARSLFEVLGLVLRVQYLYF